MKIAILTTFMEFNSGYSLTGIVKDQITMLLKYGHEVHLYVNEKYHSEDTISSHPNFYLHWKIPFTHLKDYSTRHDLTPEHIETKNQMSKLILDEMQDYDAIFTHDFIFTGWNLPYALGIQDASSLVEKPAWMHWIHSVPSGNRDWWEMAAYGDKHKIVYPNQTDARKVAECYRALPQDVITIPHIKDLRTWFDFSKETCEFIDAFPGVMQSQVVQILPASVDRLSAKRVKEVIILFSKLKKRRLTVCLVVANQWATQTQQKEEVDKYLIMASSYGLIPMKEVIFTSEWQTPKYDAGIPKVLLRELFQCSNLFIFPTKEESFGLVVPEASLSSGCLLVLNKSLYQQMEITKNCALYFDFGSFHNNFEPEQGWDKYMNDMVAVIIHRLQQSESLKVRTICRLTYNMDNLYNMYYEPTIKGSVTW